MTSETTTYLAIALLVIILAICAFKQLGNSLIGQAEQTSKAISGSVKR